MRFPTAACLVRTSGCQAGYLRKGAWDPAAWLTTLGRGVRSVVARRNTMAR